MDSDDEVICLGADTTDVCNQGMNIGSRRSRRLAKRNVEKTQQAVRKTRRMPLETVDLVECEKSDHEETKKKVTIDGWLDISVEDNFEEEETEEVKVLWNNNTSKIERFTLKRTDPLLPVFEFFAKLNGVDTNRILILTNNFDPVHQYDSIETLNLKVTNFLIASLTKNDNNQYVFSGDEKSQIELKCQFKDKKQPLLFHIHCNQPFSALAEQCASKIGCSVEKIKLYFDGDVVAMNETPNNLEFEGGECIDVHT